MVPQIARFYYPMNKNIVFPGKDLPKPIGPGPRMSPTAGNKGLIMTYEKDVYSFHCESHVQCYWRLEECELKIKRHIHVMMTVPSSLVKDCT